MSLDELLKKAKMKDLRKAAEEQGIKLGHPRPAFRERARVNRLLY